MATAAAAAGDYDRAERIARSITDFSYYQAETLAVGGGCSRRGYR